MSTTNKPDTIVLIHGLWMTPRSWEHWIPRYERRGYNVIAPSYPGFEVDVEALHADPTPVAKANFPATLDHYAGIIEKLDKPPIIMGHSFGGTITQLLIDRGYGAAGVLYNSAPTEGVRVNPPSQVRSLFVALNNPLNARKAVGFTEKQFNFAFTNTLSLEESRPLYDRYHIAAPGSWIWKFGLLANLTPGHQDTWVNYKNNERAPLLFIAGGSDHIMPPSVNRSNLKHYKKSMAVTEYYEFPDRPHFMVGMQGWEDVADYGLNWAEGQVSGAPVETAEKVMA
jgi:pimeloyl-ACP methyl ester carboxylesterase